MAQPKIYETTAYARTNKVLLNYVTNLDAVALGREQLDTITLRVWEHTDECEAKNAENGVEVGEETEIDVATSVYDDLQTGNGWPENQTTGWNLKALIPASYLPTAGWYRVEITLTPTQTYGEDPFYVVWLIKVLPIAS